MTNGLNRPLSVRFRTKTLDNVNFLKSQLLIVVYHSVKSNEWAFFTAFVVEPIR